MGYNAGDVTESGGKADEGTYRFVVGQAAECTFNNGSNGMKTVLSVAAFDDRDINDHENFSFKPAALWKLREFLTCIGLDFNRNPSAEECIGKCGKAEFIKNDRGYLAASEFLAPPANNGPDTAGYNDDDCPF